MPQISRSELWLWEAFSELSRCGRPIGFGPARIKMSEIEAYCRLCHYDEMESYHVKTVVVSMDSVWFEWAEAEAASQKSE